MSETKHSPLPWTRNGTENYAELVDATGERAAEEATRAMHYEERDAAWEQAIWTDFGPGSTTAQMTALVKRVRARLLPRPPTLQERVEAILDVHGLHHISDAGNKIVAAEIVALLEARK